MAENYATNVSQNLENDAVGRAPSSPSATVGVAVDCSAATSHIDLVGGGREGKTAGRQAGRCVG